MTDIGGGDDDDDYDDDDDHDDDDDDGINDNDDVMDERKDNNTDFFYPVIRSKWVFLNLYSSGYIYHGRLCNISKERKFIDVFCIIKVI